MATAKEEWVNQWLQTHPTADKEVLNFICAILYKKSSIYIKNCKTMEYNPYSGDAIYNLFACGYCYYFALMLKDAFNRGEIMWHKGFSHIVWQDVNGICYEIGGVFYDYNEEDIVPISTLSEEELGWFKHVDANGIAERDKKDEHTTSNVISSDDTQKSDQH